MLSRKFTVWAFPTNASALTARRIKYFVVSARSLLATSCVLDELRSRESGIAMDQSDELTGAESRACIQ